MILRATSESRPDDPSGLCLRVVRLSLVSRHAARAKAFRRPGRPRGGRRWRRCPVARVERRSPPDSTWDVRRAHGSDRTATAHTYAHSRMRFLAPTPHGGSPSQTANRGTEVGGPKVWPTVLAAGQRQHALVGREANRVVDASSSLVSRSRDDLPSRSDPPGIAGERGRRSGWLNTWPTRSPTGSSWSRSGSGCHVAQRSRRFPRAAPPTAVAVATARRAPAGKALSSTAGASEFSLSHGFRESGTQPVAPAGHHDVGVRRARRASLVEVAQRGSMTWTAASSADAAPPSMPMSEAYSSSSVSGPKPSSVATSLPAR